MRGRQTLLTQYWNGSMLAMVLGVMPAGLGVVMLGMAAMAIGAVGVARCLFVMLCYLVVMLNACVVAHKALPVWRRRSAILTQKR
ncbi:hypothetical protein AS156_37530 [Bradyrhizobium macuxiense]|uniref:Uncharacterized protein n=1 Tax=Bradyrhizobium macuxiense TaxID=1755647 RepID=A0A120FQ30_9BRAD|nr:hypothetical protein AS156_37530 [Bradyrhizobium macuxiense]